MNGNDAEIVVKLVASLTIVSINASTIKYLLIEEGFLIEDANLYGLLMELEVEEK